MLSKIFHDSLGAEFLRFARSTTELEKFKPTYAKTTLGITKQGVTKSKINQCLCKSCMC